MRVDDRDGWDNAVKAMNRARVLLDEQSSKVYLLSATIDDPTPNTKRNLQHRVSNDAANLKAAMVKIEKYLADALAAVKTAEDEI